MPIEVRVVYYMDFLMFMKLSLVTNYSIELNNVLVKFKNVVDKTLPGIITSSFNNDVFYNIHVQDYSIVSFKSYYEVHYVRFFRNYAEADVYFQTKNLDNLNFDSVCYNLHVSELLDLGRLNKVFLSNDLKLSVCSYRPVFLKFCTSNFNVKTEIIYIKN